MKRISILIITVLFSAMAMAQNPVIEKETEKTIVSEPTFKGIQDKINIDEFLTERTNYPKIAEKYLQEGTVVVRFNVQETGKLSDIEVINSVSHACDGAVVSSLLATNGMWKPGTINGDPVVMEKEANVVFMLDESDMYKSAQEYIAKALDLMNKGKYKRAIRLYNEAIKIAPNHTVTLYQRGLAMYYSGDQDGAMKDFKRLGELESNLADVLLVNITD